MKLTRKTIGLTALGLFVALAFLVAISRHLAVQRADAFAREWIHEEWIRSGVRIGVPDQIWAPRWCVSYKTDRLTGTPPYVETTLGGKLVRSNIHPIEP
jgi:hypothetical protein